MLSSWEKLRVSVLHQGHWPRLEMQTVFREKATAAQLLHDLYTVREYTPTLLSQHSVSTCYLPSWKLPGNQWTLVDAKFQFYCPRTSQLDFPRGSCQYCLEGAAWWHPGGPNKKRSQHALLSCRKMGLTHWKVQSGTRRWWVKWVKS